MTPIPVPLAALQILAESPDNTGPDFGKASPLGLLVVVLLMIGMFFLLRSMNRHLKRVPEQFGDRPADTPADEDGPQDSPRESSG